MCIYSLNIPSSAEDKYGQPLPVLRTRKDDYSREAAVAQTNKTIPLIYEGLLVPF